MSDDVMRDPRLVIADVLLEAGCQAVCCTRGEDCECAWLSDGILAAFARHGLAVVPVEPTDAMLLAGYKAHYAGPARYSVCNDLRATWPAMLAAAQERAAKEATHE